MKQFLKIGVLSAVSTFLYFSGCSTVSRSTLQSKNLRVGIAESLKPGLTSKAQVNELFGPPDQSEKIAIPESPDSGLEDWQYKDGDETRLSVTFDAASQKVVSFSWNMAPSPSQETISSLKTKFGGANWTPRTSNSTNPHYYSNECFLENNSLGVSIQFNRSDKSVKSIYRWDAHRNPSTNSVLERERKKESCLGGTCSNYSPSQLDSMLCQVP